MYLKIYIAFKKESNCIFLTLEFIGFICRPRQWQYAQNHGDYWCCCKHNTGKKDFIDSLLVHLCRSKKLIIPPPPNDLTYKFFLYKNKYICFCNENGLKWITFDKQKIWLWINPEPGDKLQIGYKSIIGTDEWVS